MLKSNMRVLVFSLACLSISAFADSSNSCTKEAEKQALSFDHDRYPCLKSQGATGGLIDLDSEHNLVNLVTVYHGGFNPIYFVTLTSDSCKVVSVKTEAPAPSANCK
ncbi:MAG: hypothetical protein ACXWRE_14640 [Pseudobdellovibrionaceae bacterium]